MTIAVPKIPSPTTADLQTHLHSTTSLPHHNFSPEDALYNFKTSKRWQ